MAVEADTTPGLDFGMRDRFFGELREAREGRAMSLEAVSAATKVAPRHLRALEEGELQELPAGIFRKGIVRAYLQAVGLEVEEKLAEFEGVLAALGESTRPAVNLEEIAEGVERSRGGPAPVPAMRWPGMFAMVALLLVFGWCIWHFALKGRVLLSRVHGGLPVVTVRLGAG